MQIRTIMVILGTRPEAIKLAPVIRELCNLPNRFRTVVCATGQHREMLAQVLSIFQIKPDFSLEVMKPGQSLTEITTSVMQGLDKLLGTCPVDLVIVQGDTTTAVASALQAFYHRIPVAHVEAGLRTKDKYNPFPEEINRRLISPIADFHFAPTELARANLIAEGFEDARILVTGNTVIDSLNYVRSGIQSGELRVPELGLNLNGHRLVVVTAHRRESFGEPLRQICEAIRILAISRADIHVAYPVHLNPNISGPVNELLGGLSNVSLFPPLDYVSFVSLMLRAELLLTDSGGIQEEGPALGKPVLVMRDTSERPEAIAAGGARLVGTNAARIRDAVSELLDDRTAYNNMANRPSPFGDGMASARIAQFLETKLL